MNDIFQERTVKYEALKTEDEDVDEGVKVDMGDEMSGEMNVPPKTQSKAQFDFSSFTQFQRIPSPLEMIQWARKYIRPWSEFLNWSNFKTAASMPRLTGRFVRNLNYFQSNYIFVFIILMIYCLITSPLILIVLAAVAFGSHKIRQKQIPLSVMGYQLTTNHQIMALNIASVPILFLVGAGAALFWTLGASCFVIFLHAMFYNIDAIVTEESEGFLSEVV